DADLRGMVVLRSLGFQLVPFKLHRFRKQRRVDDNGIGIFSDIDLHCWFTMLGRDFGNIGN
ncbi:hypothetical protein ACW5WG_19965, partial [Aeromonas salmonicida]